MEIRSKMLSKKIRKAVHFSAQSFCAICIKHYRQPNARSQWKKLIGNINAVLK